VRSTLRKPLGCERTEVFDVVRDHGATFAARHLKDHPVAAGNQVVAIGNRYDVIARMAQHLRDLGREMVVEAGPHARKARTAAKADARPRSYSASLSAISLSISSVYSP